MGQLCKCALFALVLMAVLHNSSGGKSFGGKKTSSKKPSQGTKTQPNNPRQPSYPAAGSYPGYPNQQYPGKGGSSPGAGSYPAGGSYPSGGNTNQYPGRGGSNPGGYPNQNPGAGSYPAGGNTNQYPGRGGSNPGGYPNQNPGAGSYPAGGSYPSAGGNTNQYPGRGGSNPGGYPNQNPGAGSYPAGGNTNQYPGRGGSNPGGYPNQNPGAGAYPAGGSYPSAGGYPNPGRGGSNPGGYPNQNPGAGTYPAGGYPNPGRGGVNPGGYPNQNPAGGGYPNQYPGRSGYSPGGYPAGGSYPVRTAGQPGGYPGGQPSIGGGYPNWNPNNKILSPRYGGSFGGGGFGMGGSPFSNTVKSMGYGSSLKSKGFAKKAMLAAGVGAMAGMAVGYGIGNFQRPNFEFRSPQEERQYNHYMYKHQGTRSKDKSNKGGPNNTSKQQSQAHMSYEQYMNTCMKRKDLLKEQDTTDSTDRKNIQRDEPLTEVTMKIDYQGGPEKNDTASPTTASDYPKASAIREEDDDTVSIVQIGYPALIEQMKARKCVEMFLVYSESFAEKQKEDKKDNQRRNISSFSNNHNGLCVSGVLLLLTTSFMPLSST